MLGRPVGLGLGLGLWLVGWAGLLGWGGVGSEADGLLGCRGLGWGWTGWAGLGREWGGRGQEFCDWNLIF